MQKKEDEALAPQKWVFLANPVDWNWWSTFNGNWIIPANDRRDCSDLLMLSCTHGKSNLQYRIGGFAKAVSCFHDENCGDTKPVRDNVQNFVVMNFNNVVRVDAKSALYALKSSFALDYLEGS